MALPAGFPPRSASGRRSIRAYFTGTPTVSFDGFAKRFIEGAGANPFAPQPVQVPDEQGGVDTQAAAIPLTPTGAGTKKPADSKPAISPELWSYGLRISCDDADATKYIEVSFDGVNVHGKLFGGKEATYFNRIEAGIAVRGTAGSFRVEAW